MITKKRCNCNRGAKRGEYDLSQCRVCWHELNTPDWFLPPRPTPIPIPQPSEGQVLTIGGGPVVWASAITTVPERESLLHRTLSSLAIGGFGEPQVFVERGLKAFGTWWHALVELWIRNPHADRYAMFQDDVVCCKNLRRYLDAIPHPPMGYWNLFTYRENEKLVKEVGDKVGWFEASILKTTPYDPKRRDQVGVGALALVFPRRALVELLTSKHLVTRPMDRSVECKLDGNDKADRNIDGCVVTAMNKAGYREYVHVPSLVQHTGDTSVIGWEMEEQLRILGKKRPPRLAKSFPGESFDAMNLLK